MKGASRLDIDYEGAGLEPERASTHSMRKTAATWLYEVTKDLKCVQSFLGHSESETTEQYIDLAFRVVREGVAKFSDRLSGVFLAENDGEKNDTKSQVLLHFSDDAITIPKERYYRLLEIEAQYKSQQQETRRLQQLLEQVIQTFDDNPKILYFKKHLQKRLA